MKSRKIKVTPEQMERLAADLRALPTEPISAHLSDDEFVGYVMELLDQDVIARVEAHLASCAECAAEAERLLTAWETEPIGRLVLGRQGWQWRPSAEGPLAAAAEYVAAAGRRIGAWRLRPTHQVGFAFSDDRPPPLAGEATLPDDMGRVMLQIVPELVSATHRWIWHLHLDLESGVPEARIAVGLGNARGAMTGLRDLRPGTPVVFQVEPPTGESYWLYFEWKTPQGEWRTKQLELPFGDEGHGRARQ